jgi:hypothetical protein
LLRSPPHRVVKPSKSSPEGKYPPNLRPHVALFQIE